MFKSRFCLGLAVLMTLYGVVNQVACSRNSSVPESPGSALENWRQQQQPVRGIPG